MFHWLEQPTPVGALTIRHLFPVPGAPSPGPTVDDYVQAVYVAWVDRHRLTIETWFQHFVLAERVASD